MTSELTKEEFELHLKAATVIGEPLIMGSPFAIFTIFESSNKPFLGEFNNSEFRITRNSILPLSHSGYLLKGNYKKDKSGKLNVDYEVKPMWFLYIGRRLVPFIFLVVINIVFYLSREATAISYVLANAFLFAVLYMAIKLDMSTKEKLERKFQQEFRLKS